MLVGVGGESYSESMTAAGNGEGSRDALKNLLASMQQQQDGDPRSNTANARANRAEQAAEPEDLREFYITPTYLAIMKDRAREWSDEFIREQHRIFRGTAVADYPEVLDLLESELHRRNLNRLRKGIRGKAEKEILALREKYASEADYVEVIDTELEIRGGAHRLVDRSDGRTELRES